MATNIDEDLKYMREVLETQYPEGKYEDGDIWNKICAMKSNDEIDTNLCGDIDLDIHPELPDNVYSLFFLGDSSYFPGFYNKSAIYYFDLECCPYEEDRVYDSDGNYFSRSGGHNNFDQYIRTILTDFLKIYTNDDEYKKTALLILDKLET
jgi:hypothetical protein